MGDGRGIREFIRLARRLVPSKKEEPGLLISIEEVRFEVFENRVDRIMDEYAILSPKKFIVVGLAADVLIVSDQKVVQMGDLPLNPVPIAG